MAFWGIFRCLAILGLDILPIWWGLVLDSETLIAVCVGLRLLFGLNDVLLLLQLAYLVLREGFLRFFASLVGELAAGLVLGLLLHSALRTMNALIADFSLHCLFLCLVATYIIKLVDFALGIWFAHPCDDRSLALEVFVCLVIAAL